MLRRLLGLTLFAQMLFVQLLTAYAHSHADPSGTGNSRPHVHLDSLPLVALTTGHAPDRHAPRQAGERSFVYQAELSSPEDDHDADAVYLPTDPVVSRPTTQPLNEGADLA